MILPKLPVEKRVILGMSPQSPVYWLTEVSVVVILSPTWPSTKTSKGFSNKRERTMAATSVCRSVILWEQVLLVPREALPLYVSIGILCRWNPQRGRNYSIQPRTERYMKGARAGVPGDGQGVGKRLVPLREQGGVGFYGIA